QYKNCVWQSDLVTRWRTFLLDLHSFPTRRSSDLVLGQPLLEALQPQQAAAAAPADIGDAAPPGGAQMLADQPAAIEVGKADQHRSEEHTSELQSRENLVCRLLLEKKKRRC